MQRMYTGKRWLLEILTIILLVVGRANADVWQTCPFNPPGSDQPGLSWPDNPLVLDAPGIAANTPMGKMILSAANQMAAASKMRVQVRFNSGSMTSAKKIVLEDPTQHPAWLSRDSSGRY